MAGWKIPDPIYDPFNGNIVINYYWLVVSTPEKYESQIGSSSQLLGKITAMFQTTNQISSLIPIHDISPETAPWPGPSPSRSFQCPRGPRAPRRRAGARRRSRCLTTGGQVETKKTTNKNRVQMILSAIRF